MLQGVICQNRCSTMVRKMIEEASSAQGCSNCKNEEISIDEQPLDSWDSWSFATILIQTVLQWGFWRMNPQRMMQIDWELMKNWWKMLDEAWRVWEKMEGKFVTILEKCEVITNSVMISNLYQCLNPIC